MKSLYQFRLLDELKASDTQVRISQLIGRKKEDGSLKDVEFQKETVVLQNGDGSVFEMAFASASGGILTFHKRGLDENNPPVEKEYNKKTWGNGTKCYVTAGAGDFIDKDEPGVWNGKQTFEGGIIVKGDTAFDGQIDAKRGVKNPTFASKEEATSFFSESEKVEGLLVNIKGNTYRWNSITKSWEMLGLADINQEKVQENSTKISSLEEKITTAEGQISQLVEAGTPSYLGITGIVGEKYTMEDTLFLQKTPTLADSTIAINVGDTNANKEQHIQRIASGTASNQLKLKMKKFGAPTTSVVVEVRKGVKVDVSDKEAYRYGGEVVATTTIAYSEFLTEWKEFTLTLNNQFGGNKGELLDIVVYQQGGIVNGTNYYQIACDATQYSEAFSYVAVNGSSRVRGKLMPYCVSEGFIPMIIAKQSGIHVDGNSVVQFTRSGDTSDFDVRYQGNSIRWYSINNSIQTNKKYLIKIDLKITNINKSSGYEAFFEIRDYSSYRRIIATISGIQQGDSKDYEFYLEVNADQLVNKNIAVLFNNGFTGNSYNYKIEIYELKKMFPEKAIAKPLYPKEIKNISEKTETVLLGFNGIDWISEIDSKKLSNRVTTGSIPLGQCIGFAPIIAKDGKRYKIPIFGD